jgi:type IV secretory pathway VirB6-like protein
MKDPGKNGMEDDMEIIVMILGFLLLGFLSAVLSLYNKNPYVKLFNDIWGREDDEQTAARVGRGFVFGLLFPFVFVGVVFGLIALIIFIIIAGIIAALFYVAVEIINRVLPVELIGETVMGFLAKAGVRIPAPPACSDQGADAPPQS